MRIGRWWEDAPKECFWLEITDRVDLGADLNAPAEREEGGSYWGYDFVREVSEGDVVFHYRAWPHGAITQWSRALGDPYEDEVVWGAHGQASGRGPVEPYPRPGWRHPLEGPFDLSGSVTKEELRNLEDPIREVYENLSERYPGHPLYFPFQLSDTRPLRAFQGYLTKLPREVVELVPALAEVDEIAAATRRTAAKPAPGAARSILGGNYRPANPEVRTAQREPFSVDPDLVDRALQGHARTQELLAAAVRAAGLVPRSHVPGEPAFDLAWEDGDALVVAEVKSLTKRNEERQLRLALGQVLRYSHLLEERGRPVRPVIATEREPTDASWSALGKRLGVAVVWPQTFARIFEGR
jgi:hypothetical protein